MKEFKGTPGPWVADSAWIETESRIIAEVKDSRDECEIFKPLQPETLANGKLIAAAPELLRELQRAVQVYDALLADGYLAYKDDALRAQAVINKALGE